MKAYVEKKTYGQDTKLAEDRFKCTVKCEFCGHSMILSQVDKTICTWCGHYVYKNEMVKFRYKLRQQLLKEKMEGIIRNEK